MSEIHNFVKDWNNERKENIKYCNSVYWGYIIDETEAETSITVLSFWGCHINIDLSGEQISQKYKFFLKYNFSVIDFLLV